MGNKKQRRAEAARALAKAEHLRSGVVFHTLLRGMKRRILDSRLEDEVDLRVLGHYKYEANLAFMAGTADAAAIADFVRLVNQLYDLHASDAPRLMICAGCNRLIGTLRCGRCGAVMYCDDGCQAAHWPAHKASCACASAEASASATEAAIDVD